MLESVLVSLFVQGSSIPYKSTSWDSRKKNPMFFPEIGHRMVCPKVIYHGNTILNSSWYFTMWWPISGKNHGIFLKGFISEELSQ